MLYMDTNTVYTGPYAWLMLSSISSLGDTSSYIEPAAVGLTLACPSAAGENTAFRMTQYIKRAPQAQTKTIATINVTMVDITATSLMVRDTSLESVNRVKTLSNMQTKITSFQSIYYILECFTKIK